MDGVAKLKAGFFSSFAGLTVSADVSGTAAGPISNATAGGLEGGEPKLKRFVGALGGEADSTLLSSICLTVVATLPKLPKGEALGDDSSDLAEEPKPKPVMDRLSAGLAVLKSSAPPF